MKKEKSFNAVNFTRDFCKVQHRAEVGQAWTGSPCRRGCGCGLRRRKLKMFVRKLTLGHGGYPWPHRLSSAQFTSCPGGRLLFQIEFF